MLSAQDAADLLTAFYANGNEIRRIQRRFAPIIKNEAAKLALTIGSNYRDELEAEGRFGLIKATLGFPSDIDRQRFLPYAIRAIKNAMIDFGRKQSRYNQWVSTGLPGFDFVSSRTSDDSPQYVSSMSINPDDQAYSFDWHESTTLPPWRLYKLDYSGYKRIGLTDRDIRMLELYLLGYKMWEIAREFGLNSAYVSRLLKTIRMKIQNSYK